MSTTCPRCGSEGFDGFCIVCGFPGNLRDARKVKKNEHTH